MVRDARELLPDHLPQLGTPARGRDVRSRRPAVRLGTRLDSAKRPPAGSRRRHAREPVGGRRHGGHQWVLHAGTDNPLHQAIRSVWRHGSVSERAQDTARREQHRALQVFSRSIDAQERPVPLGRHRPSAVERRRRWTRRPLSPAGVERVERASAEPALPRPAHAARTSSRRLHRQRQHRAYAAGMPSGRARRAAGSGVARERRVRSNRDSRHEPWFVSGAPDHRARTVDSRGGAESHLPCVRRRRLARSVHAARARRSRGSHRSRTVAGDVETNQPQVPISIGFAIGGHCSSTRATTSPSRSICRESSSRHSSASASRTRSRCSAAGTTAPDAHRSSSWMDGS